MSSNVMASPLSFVGIVEPTVELFEISLERSVTVFNDTGLAK
jgi:hypothetical protein